MKRFARPILGILLVLAGITLASVAAQRADAHESGIVVDCDSINVWEIRRLDVVTVTWQDGASASFEVGNAFTYPVYSDEHGFVVTVQVDGQYPATYSVVIPTDCQGPTTTVPTTTVPETTVPGSTTVPETTTAPETTTTVTSTTTEAPTTTVGVTTVPEQTTVVPTTATPTTVATPPPYVPEYTPGAPEAVPLDDSSTTPAGEGVDTLPNTGANSYLLLVVAAILIALGVFFVYRSRP